MSFAGRGLYLVVNPTALGPLVDDVVVMQVWKQHVAPVSKLVVASVVQLLLPLFVDLLVGALLNRARHE